jgi:hypothetical protein
MGRLASHLQMKWRIVKFLQAEFVRLITFAAKITHLEDVPILTSQGRYPVTLARESRKKTDEKENDATHGEPCGGNAGVG